MSARGRVWKGAGIGALLFAAVVAVLYLTPVRLPILNFAGREFPALRQGLQLRYAALQEREQRIAVSAADSVPEAVKTAQEKAWRDYAGQRSALMARIQLQSGISPEGFEAWVTDLWMWLLLLGFSLPVLGAWLGRLRVPPPAPHPADQALAQLKAATRRISEITTTTLPPMVEVARNQQPVATHPPEPARGESIEALSPHLFQEENEDWKRGEKEQGEKEEDLSHPPLAEKVEYLEGVDTLFQPQVLENADPEPDRHEDPKNGPEVWSPNALTMEDENSDPTGEIPAMEIPDEVESPYGKMPETTEFEQLERQREEVLRCARKGMTSSEIARRLRMGQDQVDLIIRMRRERGT